MKQLSLFFCLLWAIAFQAQVKIGDNPQALDGSSLLELESTSRVLVVTRISSEIMNAMAPLAGAIVFNTDNDCLHYYNGVQWLNLCDALTNSGNIRLTDNGDGTYTFTDADEQTTIILNTTVTNFERENDSLVLIDSANRRFSVALDSLSQNTYSTNAIFLPNANDSTIVITKTDNHYNFEVGRIGRENYGPSSISGSAHIQNGSIPPGKLVTTNQSPNNVLQIQMQGTPASPTAVWAPFSANLLTGTGGITSPDEDISIGGGINATLTHVTLGIADGAITTAKLDDNAVTSIKIADGAVTNDKLDKSAIPLSGFGEAENDVNVGNNKLINVAIPTDDSDAANKAYVDTAAGGSIQVIVSTDPNNSIQPSANDGGAFYIDGDSDDTNELQDLQISGTILNLTNPATIGNQIDLNAIFATNAELAALSIEDADADPNNEIQNLTQVLAQGADANGTTITNVGTPVADLDAATKIYVDTQVSGAAQIIVSEDPDNDLTVNSTDGGAFYIDGDSDDTNEIQDLTQVLAEGTDANEAIISNLGDPIENQDAATKIYVDTQISGAAQIIVSEDPDNNLTASLTDGGAFYIDGDSDDTNELQDLNFDPATNILTITNPETPGNQIDLSAIITSSVISGSQVDPNFVDQDIVTTGTLAVGNTTIAGTLEITGQLIDENDGAGTPGQVLTATTTGTEWTSLPTPPSPFHAIGKINITTPATNAINVDQVDLLGIGNYQVNFTSPASTQDYVIQLTLLNATPHLSIQVTAQTPGSFTVQISDSDGDPIDSVWYFTVIDL